jgi:hypothetical protein
MFLFEPFPEASLFARQLAKRSGKVGKTGTNHGFVYVRDRILDSGCTSLRGRRDFQAPLLSKKPIKKRGLPLL